MVMDGYYLQDPKQAIWDRINVLHLSYLHMEDSPQKLDKRNELEACIEEYLRVAPHHQKFYFQETAEVLHRSASCKKDFSGYKAANGWNAIQLYAGNLLAQPWRKEYREIKMYSGFYIHHIETNLVGAELIFEIMGYKHVGNGMLVLDGPVCPDRVANISRDALVAYVECQILKNIWEKVSINFVVTWLDVLEFREQHVCSPQHSINALNYRFHQKQALDQSRHTPRSTDRSRHFNTVSLPPLPMNQSFPPSASRTCFHMGNGCCTNTYAAVSPYCTCSVQMPMKTCCGGGFCCSKGHSIPITVPTGQLIELEPAVNTYDRVDGPMVTNNHSAVKYKRNCDAGDGRSDGFEDWDYVYRNLESQGYSKDLGERGDLMKSFRSERSNLKEAAPKIKTTNIDEMLVEMEKNINLTENVDKTGGKELDIRITPTSSYENLGPQDLKKIAKIPTKTNKQTVIGREKVASISSIKSLQNKNSAATKHKDDMSKTDKQPKKHIEDEDKWECKNCTFMNVKSKNICEICSRTRTAIEEPMEVGGSECSKCTLVNTKGEKVCVACGASLKDSPTYI